MPEVIKTHHQLATQPEIRLGTVDLHRHLEGSLFISSIQELARKYGVPFFNQTIEAMNSIVKNGLKSRSLEDFINLLSTRWMKLLITKIMVNYPVPEGKIKVKECLADFLREVIQHAHDEENVSVLNLLISPFNMAIDGDLNDPGNTTQELTPEEVSVYRYWSKLKHLSNRESTGVTCEEYLEVIGSIRNEMQDKLGMRIFISAAVRRDRDKKLLLDKKNCRKNVQKLKMAFDRGDFDFLDLCGLETYPEFELDQFVDFFNLASGFGVPNTFHIGEITYQNRSVAYRNFYAAFERLKQKPYILAHAVRITDKVGHVPYYFGHVKRRKIPVMVNVGTNFKSLNIDPYNHKLLTYFLKENNRTDFEETLLVPTTDDPTVLTLEATNALGNENDLFFNAVKEILKMYKVPMTVKVVQEFIEANIKTVVHELETILRVYRSTTPEQAAAITSLYLLEE